MTGSRRFHPQCESDASATSSILQRLAAERRFESGLVGHVTIAEADYWMDGGSVSVSLQDEHGTKASARYEQTLFDNPHSGQLAFHSPGAAKVHLHPQRLRC